MSELSLTTIFLFSKLTLLVSVYRSDPRRGTGAVPDRPWTHQTVIFGRQEEKGSIRKDEGEAFSAASRLTPKP